jgi:hypothetical protein
LRRRRDAIMVARWMIGVRTIYVRGTIRDMNNRESTSRAKKKLLFYDRS